MKFPTFSVLSLAAGGWIAGVAATVLPRSDLYSSMTDADPVTGSTLDTIYTDALDTCISLTAFGKTGTFANKKIMVHIAATQQQDKTNKFIGAVSSAGFEQGSIKITVTLPCEGYVQRMADMDDEFRENAEAIGGIDSLQGVLDTLGADAEARAREAVKNAGGSDDDVVTVRRAEPDHVDDDNRGRVEIGRLGKVKVEGEEVDD